MADRTTGDTGRNAESAGQLVTAVPPGDASGGRPRCCLHIGLNKTGTTTLQRRLFPLHPQIDYLGKWHERDHFRDATTRALIEPLLGPRLNDTMTQRCREVFAQRVEPSLTACKTAVWSSEGMCGGTASARRQRAQNFRDVFGPSRVLIVLRHPLSLAESLYFQKLKAAQRGTSAHFAPGSYFGIETWLQRCWGTEALGVFDYARTVRIFADVFGPDAINVLAFEELVAAPDQFVRDVCRALGVAPEPGLRSTSGRRDNVRWGAEQIERLTHIAHSPWRRVRFRIVSKRRRRRMLHAGSWQRAGLGVKARAVLSEEWQRRISDFTRDGNRELVDQWGLPLDRYDYPL